MDRDESISGTGRDQAKESIPTQSAPSLCALFL